MANSGSKNARNLSIIYLNTPPELDINLTPDNYSKEVLKTLGYFDLFKYPLNKEQIFRFSNARFASLNELEILLQEMRIDQKIYQKGDCYALRDIDEYVNNRDAGELRFENLRTRIEKTSRRLRYFPFVKFVGLSGSLSKGFASQVADIDLFIITQKDRLWICRTLLHLFKKLTFLKGSQHWYCMNYFIDETAMKIEEQNYFTAIELSTLKPLIDASDYYYKLMNCNIEWIKNELPNVSVQKFDLIVQTKNSIFSKMIGMLSSNRLNMWLMRITDYKWRKKWGKKKYPLEDYELAFKTRLNVSKNHLHNYQKKMLQHLAQLQIK